MSDTIETRFLGESFPAASPYRDHSVLGSVLLEPQGAFPVRSDQTFVLTYTAGRYGIDDTGAIRISFRQVGDMKALQTENPAALGYVSASSSNGADLTLEYRRAGQSPRPRNKSLTIHVNGGYLEEGDTIKVVFGDRTLGSKGMRLQTFAERNFEFRVSVDPCAVGHFIPLPETPCICIVPDEPIKWVAVLPSIRRPGESFHFGFKAEDLWGNPTPINNKTFTFRTSLPVNGLPESVQYTEGKKSVCFECCSVTNEGELIITVEDGQGRVLAKSNPMIVRNGEYAGFWGDLHGQSGESIGTGTVREYFDFAQNIAFLDISSHQANDFQITKAFWSDLNRLTGELNQEGKFIAIPGYEWSGNTGVGGDRNIFFLTEGQTLRRSSHALLPDSSDLADDANDVNDLFSKLPEDISLAYAHVGGRYANIAFGHDPKIETAMEIHSAWGTFEWLLYDCFELGYRVGVVCNSDDHKGRPGASYPGASTFGAYGGLTCFLAKELSREAVFDCLRRRRHYGVSGGRPHLDVRVRFQTTGNVFDRDPSVYNNTSSKALNEAIMGDIVQTDDPEVTLYVETIAQSPIERIELRNGSTVIKTVYPYSRADLGSRIRVLFCGANYRGRDRQTVWSGRIKFKNASIHRLTQINSWNHERKLDIQDDKLILSEVITTGNFSGFDIWLEENPNAEMEIESNHGSLGIDLSSVGIEDIIMEAGGLERKLRVFRLPEHNTRTRMRAEMDVPLKPGRDNPLWVCVTYEDGSQAWSSPIYVFDKELKESL